MLGVGSFVNVTVVVCSPISTQTRFDAGVPQVRRSPDGATSIFDTCTPVGTVSVISTVVPIGISPRSRQWPAATVTILEEVEGGYRIAKEKSPVTPPRPTLQITRLCAAAIKPLVNVTTVLWPS